MTGFEAIQFSVAFFGDLAIQINRAQILFRHFTEFGISGVATQACIADKSKERGGHGFFTLVDIVLAEEFIVHQKWPPEVSPFALITRVLGTHPKAAPLRASDVVQVWI